MVAFRYANLDAPGEQPARRSPARAVWGRWAGFKVAAIAMGVATAGVVLAAGTGILLNPLSDQPTTAAPHLTSSQPRNNPTGNNGVTTTGGTSGASPTARPVPDPSHVGLCRAYQAQVATNPGQALNNPAFRALIEAAGGRDKVDGYCQDLLADKPGKPTKEPGKPDHPTGQPSHPGQPTQRPNR
jgi:hypothetical protein